ncbi:MAG: GNAT family N-acetyltransferase [Flammeovirgaceae bacterium]|nr:GNAT family N-acetyltransferase [Flammeovirgaceae bacterium]
MKLEKSSCQIIPVNFSQLRQLQEISLETFKSTYAHLNNPENFKDYLENQFNEKQLISELNNPSSAFYFLQKREKIIGYFKLNWSEAQTEQIEGNALELERIYVSKKFQGNGMGKLIVDFVLKYGAEKTFDFVWLGVWEENPNAIQFYERMGFEKFGEHVFTIGNEDQTDFMMKKYVL